MQRINRSFHEPQLLADLFFSVELDLNPDDASSGSASERLSHARHQRPNIVNVVGRRNHHNDCKIQPEQILLILDTVVDSEKYIEFLSSTAKQRPVFDPRPAHLSYGMNVMAGELAP